MSESSTVHGDKTAPRALALTPRQRQILGLMCKGKANKEIAAELDISLGTVKQHIAALFKRMRVQNRSMAVARGKDLLAQPPPRLEDAAAVAGADWAEDIMLIRRPCVVLAVRVSQALGADGQASIKASLKTLANASKAFHLPGGDEVVILLFGVRRPSVWDALRALLLLQQLRNRVLEQGLGAVNALAAAVDGGMAVISINADGRWSGDTVATPVMAMTRRLLSRCRGGMLALGGGALHLLESLHGLDRKSLEHGRLPLAELERVLMLDFQAVSGAALYPRQALALGSASGKSRQLIGPLGSGKTHLCRRLVVRAREQGRAARYLRVMPTAPTAGVWDAETGNLVDLDAMLPALADAPSTGPRLLVIDDVDLLEPAQARQALLARVQPMLADDCLLILTARACLLPDGASVALGGVDAAGLESLLADRLSRFGTHLGEAPTLTISEDRDALLQLTEGIPLFVLELGASPHWDMTLPVLLAIASELDRHPLDWRLLRVLTQSTAEPRLSGIHELTAMPVADIDRGVRAAVDAGLLEITGTEQMLRFSRALMRRGIAALLI